MTNEELAIEIKQGSTRLLTTLWERIQGLVYYFANRYFTLYGDAFSKAGIEIDDLVQAGYFALLDAVKGYKPEQGYKFATYLRYPLKNHFNDILGFRKTKGCNDALLHSDSLEKPVKGTEGLTIGDSIPDAGAGLEVEGVLENHYNKQLYSDLWECVGELEELQQDVIIARHCMDMTIQETASYVNSTISKVRATDEKGLRKLRRDKRLRRYRDEFTAEKITKAYHGDLPTEMSAIMLSEYDYFMPC